MTSAAHAKSRFGPAFSAFGGLVAFLVVVEFLIRSA